MTTINDDRVLDARDMAEEMEAAKQPRTFPDVINEWTEACLKVNRETQDMNVMLFIMRMAPLAQRLMYEAYNCGMLEAVAINKELK